MKNSVRDRYSCHTTAMDCKKDSCKHINNCKGSTKNLFKGTAAILLGAGSSDNRPDENNPHCGWNMRSWWSLLKAMATGMNNADIEKLIDYEDANEYVKAGAIEEQFTSHNIFWMPSELSRRGGFAFPEHIMKSIASDRTSYQLAKYVETILKSKSDDIKKIIIDCIGSENFDPSSALGRSTVFALAKICLERAMKGVRTIVITYNYDDLFEFVLKKLIERDFIGSKDIETPSYMYRKRGADTGSSLKRLVQNPASTIDIFYVHGKIPLFTCECEDYDCLCEGYDGIVLTDSSYADLEQRRHSYANLVQSTVMAALPTITCGFSCIDKNFQRLRKELLFANDKISPILALCHCKSKHGCMANGSCEMYGELLSHEYNGYNPLPVRSGEYYDVLRGILVE